MSENPKGETLEINSGNLAAMLPNSAGEMERQVFELDGPQRAYFEIPLDWFANDNAEIEPGQSEGAVRLMQRVVYYSFQVLGDSQPEVSAKADTIVAWVRAELLKRCELDSFIWWRKRPDFTIETFKTPFNHSKPARHKVRLRLGTCPTLPTVFWKRISDDIGNISSDPVGDQGKFK